MAGTFSQITLHIVFAVNGRRNLLNNPLRDEVFRYIAGIITRKGQKSLAVGGYADHIHLLVGIRPNCSISDLVRDIKNNSSRFINEIFNKQYQFSWQNGYGVFSCSNSQIDDVYNYIQNQEKHHARIEFKDEYIDMLKKNNVEFEPKYLIDEED